MQESLLNLFKLQSIDNQLHALEKLRRDIPEQINALNRKYEEAGEILTQKQEELAALQQAHRRHERDMATGQDQLHKYQGQLHDVKTNKEYDALQAEILSRKTVITEHEDAIINLMDMAEELTRAIETLRTEVAAQQERITEERNELQKKLATTDEDIEVKLDEHKRMAMRVEARVLNAYKRIRKGRKREAVVLIKKGACGGCFYKIPLQRINEIRRLDRVITCEGCGRILFMEPEV